MMTSSSSSTTTGRIIIIVIITSIHPPPSRNHISHTYFSITILVPALRSNCKLQFHTASLQKMPIQFLAITNVNIITREEEVIYTQQQSISLSSSATNANSNNNINTNSIQHITDGFSNSHDPHDIENDLFGFGTHQHINSSNQGCSLKHQFLLHSAMEIMNKQGVNNSNSKNTAPSISTLSTSTVPTSTNLVEASTKGANRMFRGLICIQEEYRFYGYTTNTAVNIIVAVKDDILPIEKEAIYARDDMIQSLLGEIHNCYVEHTLNPFSARQGPIKSNKFQWQMRQILSAGGSSVI
jgi:hypothetical protein